MINITDKSVEDKIPPLLRLAFRPFFLLGAFYAPLAVAIWVYSFKHGGPVDIWWHAHEMIFGFGMAIVAGFLLTAVQNWTGVTGTKGKRLAVLVSLWILPRLLFWTSVPHSVILIVETLFIACVAYEVSFRVIKSHKYRNLIFLPFFLVAILANTLSYYAVSDANLAPSLVWEAMIWWFVLLISIMGGRVIPFFTARRIGFEKPNPIIWLDIAANLPLAILFILSFFPQLMTQTSGGVMVFASITQAIRFLRWRPWTTLKEPLVWSLHTAYACIPVGLLIKGFAVLGLISNGYFVSHNMIHVFAVGAIGGLILTMIARVTMGHTGREIYKGPSMWHAFFAVFIAALIRGIGVAFWPEKMMSLIDISAALWIYAFGLFVLKFAGMLMKPRADGHPG